MATLNRSAPVEGERARFQRFQFGSLEASRAALFISLGWGAACADDGEPPAKGALGCEGDAPLQGPMGLCGRDQGLRECFVPLSFPCGVPGRPFLVGAEIRRASLRARAGWCDASAGGVSDVLPGLDDRDRAQLARHYREAALLEHASIAAFARFTLQLLELGAPADLCDAAQEAMRDETLHARLCFTLASRYAGQPIAPGPLSMQGALAPATLDDVARLCLLEGCVGETLAALDAAEALAAATDPEVRAALERIAEDERRHAELAFRCVAWALEQSPAPGLRRALAAVLEATVAASRSARDHGASRVDTRLEAHGVLSEPRRSALRHAALEEVVVPCVRRLLAEDAARGVHSMHTRDSSGDVLLQRSHQDSAGALASELAGPAPSSR